MIKEDQPSHGFEKLLGGLAHAGMLALFPNQKRNIKRGAKMAKKNIPKQHRCTSCGYTEPI